MIVIVDPSPELRASIGERLNAPDQLLQVDAIAEAEQLLANSVDLAHVVILGSNLGRAAALEFGEKVERQAVGVATLLVAETLEPALLREVLRSGIDDVMTLDGSADEWREAVARAQGRAAAQVRPAGTDNGQGVDGRIVTVFSTKGGCGKSLVASNLAVLAAAATGERVGLVDLDLQSGDLAIMFQLMPALSIYDAAGAVERLDAEALAGYLTPHRANVALLAAPMEPSLAEAVTAPAVARILELMRETFPLTIIDGPPLFTDQVLVALDASDLIVLVASMDVPSIKNLRLAMNTLSQLGHPRDRIKVVLNRADSKVGLRATEVEKSLSAEIDVEIPSSRDVPLSINQGTPLAISRPKSPVATGIAKLLTDVLPASAVEADGRGGRRRRR